MEAQILPLLEIKCDVCDGYAGHMELGQWHKCPYCDGRGYEPTPAGRQIIELLTHNKKLAINGES